MRLEVFENYHYGMELAVFSGSDVVAILYTFEENDINNAINELKENNMAYLGWNDYCYHTENVVEATIEDKLEKYDDDGNPVDITEHPWTLQELYDDLWEYSELIKEVYI